MHPPGIAAVQLPALALVDPAPDAPYLLSAGHTGSVPKLKIIVFISFLLSKILVLSLKPMY